MIIMSTEGSDMAASNKTDILKKNGTYNTSHSAVKAEEFQNSLFFDAEDLAQVKYEMLRSVYDLHFVELK